MTSLIRKKKLFWRNKNKSKNVKIYDFQHNGIERAIDLTFYLFVWKTKFQRARNRSSIHWFFHPLGPSMGVGLQALLYQVHFQETELEVEQPGFYNLVPVWNAGTRGGILTHKPQHWPSKLFSLRIWDLSFLLSQWSARNL